MATLGGALWLALTDAFCLRRLRRTRHMPTYIAEMALTSALIPPLAIYWRLRGALKFRVWFLSTSFSRFATQSVNRGSGAIWMCVSPVMVFPFCFVFVRLLFVAS